MADKRKQGSTTPSKPEEVSEVVGTTMHEDSPEEAEALARKKASGKKLRGPEEEAGLTITSLMDIMTIQLVFLLVSLTSDPLNVTLSSAMQLAMSSAEVAPKLDSIPIVVTKEHIVVDNNAAVEIKCNYGSEECTPELFEKLNRCEINPNDAEIADVCERGVTFGIDKVDRKGADPNSPFIEPLRVALEDAVRTQIEQDMELGREFRGSATLVVDKEIPYKLLVEIIMTAGEVGVEDKGLSHFRLAISRNL